MTHLNSAQPWPTNCHIRKGVAPRHRDHHALPIHPLQNNPDELRIFSKEIEDFGELPALIEEAARLMGLDENKAFARDVLSVEICGPERPQL
jgi:hypothetical protein